MRQSFLPISGLFLYFWLFTFTKVQAGSVVIDDADPRWTYSPSDKWNVGQTCDHCSAHPDASQVQDGTWHDGAHFGRDTSWFYSASVSFTGTGFAVYGVKGHGDFAARDLTFLIDGQKVGTYSQPDPDASGPQFTYNFQFFSKQDLSPAQHTLTIQNGANAGPDPSLLLLDYIVYTEAETSKPVSSPNPTSNGPTPNDPNSGTGGTTGITQNSPHSVTSTSSDTQASASSHTTSNTTSVSATSTSTSGGTVGGTLATTSPTTVSVSATTTITATSSSPASGFITPSSDTSHSNTPIIIGSVLGALLFILLILILLVWCMRRSRKHKFGLLNSETALNNAANGAPGDAEATPTTEAVQTQERSGPSAFAFFRTRHPTIEPFRVEAPADTSTVSTQDVTLLQTMAMQDPKPDGYSSSTVAGTFPAGPKDSEPSPLPSSTLPADIQSRMVDTAITLAAEVQRLREENNLLREREQNQQPAQMDAEDEVPPPYLQPLRPPT